MSISGSNDKNNNDVSDGSGAHLSTTQQQQQPFELPLGNGIFSSVKRTVSNSFARTVTVSKNTHQTVKIENTRLKLTKRKQAFGIEYMDLLLAGGGPAVLQDCQSSALKEIQRLQGKLKKYNGLISKNKEELHCKIRKETSLLSSITVTTMVASTSTSEGQTSYDDYGEYNGDVGGDISDAAQHPTPTAPLEETPNAPFNEVRTL